MIFLAGISLLNIWHYETYALAIIINETDVLPLNTKTKPKTISPIR